MSEPRIRKSVGDLAPADLAEFPVWEFALDEEGEDGQDETTVRPWPQESPLDRSEGTFVVRARFVLADGTVRTGYLTLHNDGDDSVRALQPVVVTDDGQVIFWWGLFPLSSDRIAQNYRRLGKNSASEVFPIDFQVDVAIVGNAIRGRLSGFLSIEDRKTMRVRTTT